MSQLRQLRRSILRHQSRALSDCRVGPRSGGFKTRRRGGPVMPRGGFRGLVDHVGGLEGALAALAGLVGLRSSRRKVA